MMCSDVVAKGDGTALLFIGFGRVIGAHSWISMHVWRAYKYVHVVVCGRVCVYTQSCNQKIFLFD